MAAVRDYFPGRAVTTVFAPRANKEAAGMFADLLGEGAAPVRSDLDRGQQPARLGAGA